MVVQFPFFLSSSFHFFSYPLRVFTHYHILFAELVGSTLRG